MVIQIKYLFKRKRRLTNTCSKTFKYMYQRFSHRDYKYSKKRIGLVFAGYKFGEFEPT